MKNTEAKKQATGIEFYRIVSAGPRKAELLLTMEGGNIVTRHVKLQGSVWRDKDGNVYEVR